MTTEKLVMNSLFGKTELASVKIELAYDFGTIIKDTDSRLKSTSDAVGKLNKAAAAFIDAKKAYSQFQNVPSISKKC